ncbi:histone-lysine N-methyltransferase trithorax [Tribolium madens]|uniref:histone-lysine N-methyltransferase trithorax n=1 Tax=Tribolium madens TaxID=41895 RepID=UPI001CF74B05|nr:histone-lysine N-methyltransferase trithorax [Tribolium madens]
MGRSKFPGKPSKHVNRKRINVLPPTSEGIIESSRSMTVETVAENKQGAEKDVEKSSESVNLNNINTKVSLRRRLNRKMQSSKALMSNNSSKRGLISKLCNKTSVSCKLSVKSKLNCTASRKANINRKSVHAYSPIKNFRQCRTGITKESNNLVGKFVLPTRSVHSSRVIKPNKRFINVDLSDTLTLKKRVITKRHCIKQSENPSKTNKSDSASEPPTKTFSNGRVVLRQARLKLHNQTPKGSEGPFSSSSTNGSPPGTVTCGVCGAVRFYRFVKQARKFNIYSCESCRKFISKMIKRQSCGKNLSSATLVCHKGQGMCHVPPIVRSQQMKLIRCAYKSRCPACWLKMCLRSFQMPQSLKNSLIQLLPKNMQGSNVMFNNSLPLLWQVSVQNINKPEQKTVNQRPVRFKNTKPVTQSTPTSDIKRQKIDLKGPRVKHVCRSASIVLGQPLAMFPGDVEKKRIEECPRKAQKTSENIETPQVKLKDVECSENESDNDKSIKVPLVLNENLISQIKRDRNHRVPFSSVSSSSSLQSFTSSTFTSFSENKSDFEKKPNLQEVQNMISINYWDNYDLDDVNQNGFCLIASQQFPMPAICFLCGSAGREALLHCSLCCEPYHPFCLERSPQITASNNRQNVWICPRCTTCNACNQADRQKIHCQKCSKAYHSECLNTDWAGKGKPMICSKCLSCKDCGDINTANFFGNSSLCVTCFKLRRKGSCPVCLIPFREIDTNEKMMECTKCKKWIHADCEDLSEEYYHILSYLPESVKYLCCVCSKHSPPAWRKSVESELKYNFNQVLRLLSKNKTAKNMLKLNLLNNYVTLTRTTDRKSDCENDGDDNQENLVTYFNSFKNSDSDRTEAPLKSFSDFKINQTRTLTVLDIKRKANSNEYSSVKDFHKEMEEGLAQTQSDELVNIYRLILKSVFPWFDISQDSKWNNTKQRFLCNNNNDEDICGQIECVSIDSRYCSFCKSIGDGLSHLESRLLYCGQNEWVHINCALWSSEVYEEIDGSLQNVHSALSRGRLMRCSYCKQKGATVGCCFKNCCEIYHFICARTAKCHFMHDKTVYCCSHELPKTSSVIVTSNDFNIRRSVFVELADYKKGQYSQIEKVNVMVGSLCVTNLGKINPVMSDTIEAIIPVGYNCSKLFWSTVEPWRLVSYKISTSILNAHVNNLHVDKSFTVDHSLPKSVVERKLKEILLWHKDIDKKKLDVIEFDDEEEPQNGADLLSPEITDAIFEELPHELLDGISVQDIFPKLMSYEDFISMDSKSETTNSDNNVNSELKKSEEVETMEEFDDVKKQKTCSLTLSCKLDNSFSPVIKKRKITPRENNLFFQLLQVDGNFDDSSSDCGSPVGVNNVNIWDSDVSEEPVTCERCQCTYRTQASYKRHLDACEIICTSESDSELNQDQDTNHETTQIHVTETTTVNTEIPPPVLITSYESYQNEIHTSVLNTQTFVASKSNSEVITVPQNPEIIIPQTKPVVNSEVFTVSQSTVSVNEQTSQPFCLPPTVSLCVNSPLPVNPVLTAINPQMEFQPIQSMPYSTNVAPVINVTPQNQITFTDKLLNNSTIINSMINVPGNRWVKPVEQKSPTKIFKGRRSIAAKRGHEEETIVIPASSAPVIVQHLPSNNFIPTFVDTFQQQSGQNVQYVTTISPQINSTINPQPLVQLQADSNLISLLPGIQPTMIIQQPRVLENQLIVDGNGSLSWTPPQVQPVYYGFETIVQNTVMQSQQFLPTTVPGVLTANSSYSTTTQVFQTSKLEPVLDVATNSFVLLNTGQLVNSQSLEVPQNTLTNVIQQTEINQCKYSTPAFQKPNNQPISVTNTNSITLPTAPFVPEQGIPTNIVTPTPKSVPTTQNRPMSRVLPMQTLKETKEPNKVKIPTEKIEAIRKEIKILEKVVEPVIEPDKKPIETQLENDINEAKKDSPLKLVFQKQTQDGSYKVSNNVEEPTISPKVNNFKPTEPPYKLNNNFNNRNSPVQIAPLKPIKSNFNPPKPLHILSLSDKQNRPEKTERKVATIDPPKHFPLEKKENENVPSILYTIETQDGFRYSSTSIADLWTKVFEAVQNARAAHNMPLLPSDSTSIVNSLQILGLKTSGLKYLIEQLPGATKCSKYRPMFNFPSKCIEIEDELVGHTHGSARCAPHIKRNEPYDMFRWLASKHRKPEHSLFCSDLVPRRGSVNNLPMAMRFRQLKLTSKYSVGVYRSKIHRRGLFCLRDFEAGEMVIEYSGEVIRSVLTDKREKYYNSKGIGCYMFRIDDNLVVDATMTGNAARFINHSCDPNCYSKVVEILGHKHIIIFALRRIICGEELTYDYKFPIEEDKIPCTCGTRRCRKFLN